MKFGSWMVWLALAVVAATGLGWLLVEVGPRQEVTTTVGDLSAVHAQVRIGERTVQGRRRVSEGDTISTGPHGRARLRLDDGTLVAIDGSAQLTLHARRLELAAGRIFVQGAAVAATEVVVSGASTSVASSAVAFESRPGGGGKIYCASGELVLSLGGKQTRVQSGDSATLKGGQVQVAPEKAFDDWTGGLAVPWTSALGGASTIPHVRATNAADDPGTALVVRKQAVDVAIDGEVAVTRARTIYFNGSSDAAHAKLQLALPRDAILRRVALKKAGWDAEVDAHLAIAGPPGAGGREVYGLEWAGGGWLRGDLESVAAGKTLELVIEYVEWLSSDNGRSQYRFAMDGGRTPPLVGELDIEVNAERAHSPFVAVSAGASVDERHQIHYRQTDFRPTGDLVVELSPRVVKPGVARAYVSAAGPGEDPYVMIRTEVPERQQQGITLAVVLDASMSVGPGALEAGRAVIDALLEGLGPEDSIVALAADQRVRPLGPETPKPVSAKLRAQIQQALAGLRPGGASNLGLALQQAADSIDDPSRGQHAGEGMLVYIGDGRPNVGATDARAIRRLMAKRVGGMPRLGAVAVGPAADRWLLAKLVAGAGTLHEVLDRADAARAGAALLTDALHASVRDVSLDLGPHIDRIYPRDARAVLAGSTLSVVGRLRGELPQQVGFSYRMGGELEHEQRPLRRSLSPDGADLRQRWAEARVRELASSDEPIEPAIVLANDAKLLTPWTSWFFEKGQAGHQTLPFPARVFELASEHDTAFAERVEPLVLPGSTLLEPPRTFGGGVSLEQAVETTLVRSLERARRQVRACRDARLTVRPDTGRAFTIDLSVNGRGQATRVSVLIDGGRSDPVLERCIQGVVKALPYVATGVAAKVLHTLTLPESQEIRRTRCSGASKVSLPLKRSIWRARNLQEVETYLAAAKSCELPRWEDRRALLLLMLEHFRRGEERLALARGLEEAGQEDAARFVRQETLRRVTSFQELESLSRALTQDEPKIDAELDKAYEKATTHEQRLAVVRDFLRLAPHNGLAQRRQLTLLEAMGLEDELVQTIRNLRTEAIIDAGLLAQGAAALGRLGLASEGLRSFGDLIERAPRDPWTLAYVGDRLRAEQLFDEAGAAYERLQSAVPDDAGVTLRLALAHAGAGRLDVATRLLERVSQTGGRGDDGRVGELASITRAVLLARARSDASAEEKAQLTRRLLETPLPDVASVVLVQWPPSDDPIQVRVQRERGEDLPERADFDASPLGLVALRIERGAGAARILLKRERQPGPVRPARATLAALVLRDDEREPLLLAREVQVASDGKPIEVVFEGGNLL